MWQRIQTVFLVIAIVSLLVSIFLPIWVTETDGNRHTLYALHYSSFENGNQTAVYFPYCLTAVFAIASITVALIEIGKYKNRMLQMKLGALNSLFLVGTIGCAVYFASDLMKAFKGGDYGLGLWLPGVAVLANLLANRFIRKDEKLVRDSERLR